ncbi:hypothetical protein RN51_02329 [Microbacterium oxydans]|uniref:Nucleotidyltransferase n=4 Tax=Actinomycetes TaxID=1760 RepID=A0A7D7WA15_9MICO|nr:MULTISPECIES: nucleotidyltransferase [Microbacterium]KJL21314.1 hypothetical protein RN51_02329 [Microbacterium oxydans]KKX99778.1 nucleotidyltransferase [Microbacterium sp. Ag1]KYJ98190.1 nucleotidyltransferase [Microbacterium sp. CH1]MBP5800648.1 nucleotidyltransferase [Microbacterium liquefaciens]MCB8044186.1 nucleotidyltransferase [Microbacterium oxydans]
MSQTGDIFDGLLTNLRVNTAESIADRRDEVTKALNSEFRSLTGSTANKLMVGSYGRWTAIKGISDLDLLYILPSSLRASYEEEGGPLKALRRARAAIQKRYPTTTVGVDRLVVVVEFSNFTFEVQPVFENEDGSFDYPDTYSDSWKMTKPRDEISAISEEDSATSGNLRRLCKLARAWRNKQGVVMGGLLVDTLAYNFLTSTTEHRSGTSESYGEMMRDFLLYLADQVDHDFYLALGSRQRVRVKKRFQKKAASGAELCTEAVDAAGQKNEYKKWRAVFGKSVPAVVAGGENALAARSFNDTEEFIEDTHPVDIRFSVEISCTVTQDGFRPTSLNSFLNLFSLLPAKKQLTFAIDNIDVPGSYEVRWKVLNRGAEAERRDHVRGEIIRPTHGTERREVTSFRGNHYVECYVIQRNVVVARGHIDIPIAAESS